MQPLILDDVESALAHLTELGRTVVAPVARAIRNTIITFAAVRAWPVVDHQRFVEWATPEAADDSRWLVLDPLCSPTRFGGNAVRARFRRIGTPEGLTLHGELSESVTRLVSGCSVIVLDDAAATGTTLCEVAQQVRSAGGRVVRFLVCAAQPSGRAAALAAAPDADWFSYASGDFTTIHLRDACPFVPFASRPMWNKPAVPTANGVVEVSMPVSAFRGGVWGQLTMAAGLEQTIMAARRKVVQRLAASLGRPSTVADIPLLGTNVMLPLTPTQVANESTLLADLMH